MAGRARWTSLVDPHGPAAAWTPAAARRVVAAGVLIGLLLVFGVWYAIHAALTGSDTTARDATGAATTTAPRDGSTAGGDQDAGARRDALAAAPMVSLPVDAARPHPLSLAKVPTMTIPASTGVDDLGVGTGFPRTPEGAVAQLAAIDQAAFAGGSLAHAQAVITTWAAPGGPQAGSWSVVRAIQRGLARAEVLDGGAVMTYTPTQGQIKATDGPDWVLACVNGEFAMTVNRTARAGLAHCQRMTWQGGAWRIGPGAEPAVGPSAWPGTPAAVSAGWKTFTRDDH